MCKIIFYLLTFFCGITMVGSPQIIANSVLENDLKVGKLKNGLTYIIKPNKDGVGKTYMELIVKAGYKHEDQDQLAMAHFLEHMALVKTENFRYILKNHDLLNKAQMKAADIGGKTGSNLTYYRFNFPAVNEFALINGLQFFKDIVAGKIKFDKKDVDGERGVLFEEYLMADGPQLYKEWKTISLLSNCMQHVKEPVDYQKYLQQFDKQALIRFYEDWYHPANVVLSITGTINNVKSIESLINKTFSSIPKKENAREFRPCEQNYVYPNNQYVCFSDVIDYPQTQAKPYEFQLFLSKKLYGHIDKYYFKEKAYEFVLQKALSQSLYNAQRGYNKPYTLQFVEDYQLPVMKFKVKTPKSRAKEAIQTSQAVWHSFLNKGISRQKFEELKNLFLKNWSKAETNNPFWWRQKIGNYAASNTRLSFQEFVKLKPLQDKIDYSGFLSWLNNEWEFKPKDLAVIVPKGEELECFPKDSVLNWINTSTEKKILPQPPPPKALLVSKDRKKLKLNSIKNLKKNKYQHEYVLNNGVSLILKDFKPEKGRYSNKIMLHAYRPIIKDHLLKKYSYELLALPNIMKHAGAGTWNKFQIEAFLAKTSIPFGVNPYANVREIGFKASFNLKDLELVLQLIYLYYTKFELKDEVLKDWSYITEQKLLRQGARSQFLEFVQRKMDFGDNCKNGSDTDKIELKNIIALHDLLMDKPHQWTFIFSGDFKGKKIVPLINTYLGSLPNNSLDSLVMGSPTIEPKVKKYSKQVYIQTKEKMLNAHLRQKFVLNVGESISLKEEMESYLLAKIIETKLKKLRFENKRAVYLALSSNEINLHKNQIILNIDVSVGQSDLNLIRKDLELIIEDLQQNNLEHNLYKKLIVDNLPAKFSNSTSNKDIIKSLYRYNRYNLTPPNDEEIRDRINQIENQSSKELARRYLNTANLINFVATNSTDL